MDQDFHDDTRQKEACSDEAMDANENEYSSSNVNLLKEKATLFAFPCLKNKASLTGYVGTLFQSNLSYIYNNSTAAMFVRRICTAIFEWYNANSINFQNFKFLFYIKSLTLWLKIFKTI